jgi:hypothetical protein
MSEGAIDTTNQTVSSPGQPPRPAPQGLTQEEKIVGKTLKKSVNLTPEELAEVNTKKGLL